jgi:hypothetical protein
MIPPFTINTFESDNYSLNKKFFNHENKSKPLEQRQQFK